MPWCWCLCSSGHLIGQFTFASRNTSPLTQQNSKKLNFSSPPQPNSSSTYDFLQVPGRLPVARYKRWKSKCNLKLISKHRTRLLVILITNYWFWVINLALIWSKPVVHHQFLLLEIMFTSMFTFTFRQQGRRGQKGYLKVGTWWCTDRCSLLPCCRNLLANFNNKSFIFTESWWNS